MNQVGARAFVVATLTLGLMAPIGAVAPASGATPVTINEVREVRTTWTSEFGVDRPRGVAYLPARKELLVAEDNGANASVLRLGFDEEANGSFDLPVEDPDTITVDASANEVIAVAGGDLVSASNSTIPSGRPPVRRAPVANLALNDPQGATFASAAGNWYLLDARTRAVVRLQKRGDSVGGRTRIPITGIEDGELRGIAFNPADGLLYVTIPAKKLLYGLDASGNVQKRYSLGSVAISNLAAMTFAPSADTTDSASKQDLFIADAGSPTTFGGVTEVTLAAAPVLAAAVTQQTASTVQIIETSQFNPGSPDPAGITYMPGADRLEIADSEVEEVTGAGYHGVNLWNLTRTGTVTDTGTTFPAYSKEPTGLGFDPATNTLFISDDSADRVHVVKPGPDGRFGNGDDVRTFVNARAYTSDDTEDPAFDTVSGDLFFSDAITTEIYRINPVNGVFGDANDVMTHFDVGVHGITDAEGLAFDAARNTLVVGDRSSRKIYEITKENVLLRVIDAKVPGLKVLSGLTVAPAPNTPGRRDYWIVDRAIDNGANSSENDGRIYQVSAPAAGTFDAPPTVSISSPAEGAGVSGPNVTISATASDDNGVTGVQFFDGTTSLGTDTDGSNGWTVVWNTTTAGDGAHTIRATATDTTNQTTSDTNNVTVDNSPPSVAITSPSSGATVSATTSVGANATDPQGVASVAFFVDGTTSIGTDNNGSDGWSVAWNTNGTANGGHNLTARATNAGGLSTTSAAVPVTVSNTGPSVSITSPSSGATVTATTSVVANASDAQGVASVAFFVDGTTSIGTDTNGSDGWSVAWNTVGSANGGHDLTARATNAGGLSTTSAAVPVTVSNTGGTTVTLDIPIVAGTDDIEERTSDGRIDLASTDLDMMLDNTVLQNAVGLRFRGITVPPGASISNAYVQFRADESSAETTDLTVSALASDNAAAFSTVKFSLSTAPRTTASAAWSVPAWIERRQGVEQRTGNLSAVLQQIVNRPGWASGNALALVVTGSGHRVAKAIEAGTAPILHIEYTTG